MAPKTQARQRQVQSPGNGGNGYGQDKYLRGADLTYIADVVDAAIDEAAEQGLEVNSVDEFCSLVQDYSARTVEGREVEVNPKVVEGRVCSFYFTFPEAEDGKFVTSKVLGEKTQEESSQGAYLPHSVAQIFGFSLNNYQASEQSEAVAARSRLDASLASSAAQTQVREEDQDEFDLAPSSSGSAANATSASAAGSAAAPPKVPTKTEQAGLNQALNTGNRSRSSVALQPAKPQKKVGEDTLAVPVPTDDILGEDGVVSASDSHVIENVAVGANAVGSRAATQGGAEINGINMAGVALQGFAATATLVGLGIEELTDLARRKQLEEFSEQLQHIGQERIPGIANHIVGVGERLEPEAMQAALRGERPAQPVQPVVVPPPPTEVQSPAAGADPLTQATGKLEAGLSKVEAQVGAKVGEPEPEKREASSEPLTPLKFSSKDSVEARIEKLEKYIERLNKKLDEIEFRLDQLDKKLDAFIEQNKVVAPESQSQLPVTEVQAPVVPDSVPAGSSPVAQIFTTEAAAKLQRPGLQVPSVPDGEEVVRHVEAIAPWRFDPDSKSGSFPIDPPTPDGRGLVVTVINEAVQRSVVINDAEDGQTPLFVASRASDGQVSVKVDALSQSDKESLREAAQPEVESEAPEIQVQTAVLAEPEPGQSATAARKYVSSQKKVTQEMQV